MRVGIRTSLVSSALLAAALWGLTSCNEPASVAQAANASSARRHASPRASLPSGTRVRVAIADRISSETAQVGDRWRGTTTEDVSIRDGGVIAAGSEVGGVVTSVVTARRGSRAMLELGLREIRVEGRDQSVSGSSEAVTAGSTRTRNVGAIAGGAAVGALLGKAVGDGKNAAVGGLLGGAATAGVVASSKGYQAVFPEGAVVSFTINETVAMR